MIALWKLAVVSLVGVLPRFVGDAGMTVDGHTGIVTGYDGECVTPLDSLIPPDVAASEIAGRAFEAERFFILPSGITLASLRIDGGGNAPDSYLAVTFDSTGHAVDAIYAGECDSRLLPADFEATDRFGNVITFMTEHNHIPPAYDVTPEGHARLTVWRTLRLHPSDSTVPVTLASDEAAVDIDHDGTMALASIRPAVDDATRLYERYTMPWSEAELRRMARADIFRFRPHSQPVGLPDVRRYAAERNAGAVLYCFMRDPDNVARRALADSVILAALALNADADLSRALAMVADADLRSALADALSNVIL